MEIPFDNGFRLEVKENDVKVVGDHRSVWEITSFLPGNFPGRIRIGGKTYDYDYQSELVGPVDERSMNVYYRAYEYVLWVKINIIG